MKKYALSTILLVLALVLAGTLSAFAAPVEGPGVAQGPAGPMGTSGEVTAVGTNTLTVKTADGTSVTVDTSSSTKVQVLATGASGSLSDIVVGSQIEVMGSKDSSGVVTADAITLLPSGSQVRGQVTAISSSTITVKDRDTTYTIDASSATFRSGSSSASLSDIETGQMLRAFGTLSGTTLTATYVFIQTAPTDMGGGPGGQPGGGMGGPGGTSGEVTAVGTNTLTVKTADGTSVTVDTSSSTKVQVLATGASGSLSDIVVGSQIEVMGSKDSSGVVTADAITLLPSGSQVRGQVTAISSSTITVKDRDTTYTIDASSATFRSGSSSASLSDIKTGQMLRAFGTLSGTTLTATYVFIQAAPPNMGGQGSMGAQGGGMGGPGGNGGQGGPGGPGGAPGGGPTSSGMPSMGQGVRG